MKKKALVTGGSGGLGQATAIALSACGYDVYFTYRSRRRGAEETQAAIEAAGGRSWMREVDLRELSEIDAMFDDCLETLGVPDLIVNNAAFDRSKAFLEVEASDYNDIMDANLRGAFFTAQRGAKEMIKADIRGVIINISSVHAGRCWPAYSVYAASKAALTQLTKNMALELSAHGIRVLAVQPGYFDVGEEKDEQYERIASRIPLGRFGRPEEAAELIVFCASDAASYMTGSAIDLDGGVLLPVATENGFS